MLLQVAKYHPFLWLSSIPLYIHTTPSLSIHLLTLGCFHALAVVKNAALNIEVHVSFRIGVFALFTVPCIVEM